MNSYDIPEVYKSLGIEIDKLGCVMLDVEKIDVRSILPPEYEYTSPTWRYVKGLDAGDHVTLQFGLLQNANIWREHVDAVLDGWRMPGQVYFSHIGFFPPVNDEPYSCIVAHVIPSPALLDAHHRLSLLPHIDTHPGYKPHLTLAYVKEEYRDDAINLLWYCVGDSVKTVGINYGHN